MYHLYITNYSGNQETPLNQYIPSLKLTWHLKITPWKRKFLLETIIFRGENVSFREYSSFRLYFIQMGTVSIRRRLGDVEQELFRLRQGGGNFATSQLHPVWKVGR